MQYFTAENGNFTFFLFFAQNIDRGYTLEPHPEAKNEIRGGGGGTMIYFIYIGWADFWGRNFQFQYFVGFSTKIFFMKIGKHEHYTRPLSLIIPVCVCVCVCVRACVRACVCACVCERERERDP